MKFSFSFWITRQKKPLHWYQVKLHYRVNSKTVFDISAIGMTHQYQIFERREIMKSIGPLHKMKEAPRHLLKNGTIWIEVTCYLGHFQKQEKK